MSFIFPVIVISSVPGLVYGAGFISNQASNSIDRYLVKRELTLKGLEKDINLKSSYPWPPAYFNNDNTLTRSTSFGTACSAILCIGIFIAQRKYSPMVASIHSFSKRNGNIGLTEYIKLNIPPLFGMYSQILTSSVIAGAASPLFDRMVNNNNYNNSNSNNK
jgi:hypothetical protein